MSTPSGRPTELDRRLARAFATLDASPGFMARLEARLGASAAPLDGAARGRIRARLESERRRAEAALRRRFYRDLGTVLGATAAAAGAAWYAGRLLGALLRQALALGAWPTPWTVVGGLAVFAVGALLGLSRSRVTRPLLVG